MTICSLRDEIPVIHPCMFRRIGTNLFKQRLMEVILGICCLEYTFVPDWKETTTLQIKKETLGGILKKRDEVLKSLKVCAECERITSRSQCSFEFLPGLGILKSRNDASFCKQINNQACKPTFYRYLRTHSVSNVHSQLS